MCSPACLQSGPKRQDGSWWLQRAGKPASMDHSHITQALDTQTPELGKGWMLGTSSGGEMEVQGA